MPNPLPERIAVFDGDIGALELDAIVNAANERLAPGAGVCWPPDAWRPIALGQSGPKASISRYFVEPGQDSPIGSIQSDRILL
jgi:O-acetyl-ADP-ribose deacetylase (regulator of RNase III)